MLKSVLLVASSPRAWGGPVLVRVVAQLRRELGMNVVEPFVVLSSAPDEMAQVDWGQAKVMLAGVTTVVHLFCLKGSVENLVGYVRRYALTPVPEVEWMS